MNLQFDHVAISVASIETTARFYRDVLGFDIEEHRFTLPWHDIRGLVLRHAEGARVELFERPGSAAGEAGDPVESTRRQGYFQFAFAVPEIAAAFDKALAAGARPVKGPGIAPDGVTRFAFIADPDGNLIEFIERAAA